MRSRHLAAKLAAAALAITALVSATGAQPAGAGAAAVSVLTVKAGLDDPAAFTFTAKGKIFYLERGTGQVRILNPTTDNDRLFFKVPGVNGDGERGALGVALHPNYPKTPYVYVYATRNAGGQLRNQILRIRAADGKGQGFKVLLSTPASSSPYHNGGRIAFGPDGKLYAIIGDGHNSANAQDTTKNLRGKILRMNADGGVPKDNPIGHTRIWAFGIRNSYGFTWDPQTDRLWETENGPECNDEINLIVGGGNFAWGPGETCSGMSPGNTNQDGPMPQRLPKAWFVSTIGITGNAFCEGCGLGPTHEGSMFFGDVNTGKLRSVSLNMARDDVSGGAVDVLDAPNGVIFSMETGPNGWVYFSDPVGIYRLTT